MRTSMQRTICYCNNLERSCHRPSCFAFTEFIPRSHLMCFMLLSIVGAHAYASLLLQQALGFNESKAIIVPLLVLLSINLLFNNWAKDQVSSFLLGRMDYFVTLIRYMYIPRVVLPSPTTLIDFNSQKVCKHVCFSVKAFHKSWGPRLVFWLLHVILGRRYCQSWIDSTVSMASTVGVTRMPRMNSKRQLSFVVSHLWCPNCSPFAYPNHLHERVARGGYKTKGRPDVDTNA